MHTHIQYESFFSIGVVHTTHLSTYHIYKIICIRILVMESFFNTIKNKYAGFGYVPYVGLTVS